MITRMRTDDNRRNLAAAFITQVVSKYEGTRLGRQELGGEILADVEGALNEASIFALPSRVEGFPMSVMEAMAYGLPTVAFDCAPGVRELITDESDGLLVQPGNTTEFAEALARLMSDEGLRAKLGRQARTSVRRFSADVVMDRWERMFDLVDR